MQLVPIDSIYPSTYNPRESDPQRLRYIELSLRKLGFLLPIYVCEGSNEILSGHQRHYVSKKMGLTQVPVEFVKSMDLAKRKGYNVAFNRGTNDMGRNETSASISQKLKAYDIEDMATKLPDTSEMFPCLNTVEMDAKELARINIKREDKYCSNMARVLSVDFDAMPVIVNKDKQVINGIGRLFFQVERGATKVRCIVIPDQYSTFAHVMLNLVSMDFTLQKKYADDLRYNSFRRALITRQGGLGLGMIVGAFGGSAKSKNFLKFTPEQRAKWVAKYGSQIIDFGAGRLTDTDILRANGIKVSPFEPFYCQKGSNEIDREASVQIAREFLRDVASGVDFSTIFISSVFNSVPFYEDRVNILAICAALCSRNTLLSVWTMTKGHASYKQNETAFFNERMTVYTSFKLDYEDGILLSDMRQKPKVQKFHTKEELHRLCSRFFSDVKIGMYSETWLAECRNPKVDIPKLSEALEFEFNLKYPDGHCMGLVEEAKAAFSKRLGVSL